MATMWARKQAKGVIRYTAMVRLRGRKTVIHQENKTPCLSGCRFFEISVWQRTRQTSLEFLEKHLTGEVNVLRLTAAMLIDHVRARRADGEALQRSRTT